ncbi:MAG: Uma2 family endonuclease [Dehalococcoidia bacterium]
MASAPTSTSVVEQWPELPERKGYEYLEGTWVKIPMANPSTRLAFNLLRPLADFVDENELGEVFPHEFGYQIWPNFPRRYRKPDGSFISRERLLGMSLDDPLAHVAPDLAIEVISPTDRGSDIEEKVQAYFDAGVRLVWVVYPKTRSVNVYRADGSAFRLVGDSTLSGEDIVPGFTIELSDLFGLR